MKEREKKEKDFIGQLSTSYQHISNWFKIALYLIALKVIHTFNISTTILELKRKKRERMCISLNSKINATIEKELNAGKSYKAIAGDILQLVCSLIKVGAE